MLHDLRHGWRTLLASPGFTAAAILTLAVGIGANTAIFSVVYALLLKPLPFNNPEELIYAHDTFPAVPSASVSLPKFMALRDGNRTLTALGAMTTGSLTITGRGEPQQIQAARVSGDFLRVFGVPPLRGRWIEPRDEAPNAAGVIVLSYGLWHRSFGGDPAIVGQQIVGDGEPRTVVAVMPPGFTYPVRMEAWVPLTLPPNVSIGSNFLRLVGRMKPGVTLTQATDDLKAVTAAFSAEHKLQRDVRVYPLHEFLAATSRRLLLVLQGVVLLVLLIACANVANMLLARSVARRRELAIRAAIGASPGRLVRQLLTESVMLSAAINYIPLAQFGFNSPATVPGRPPQAGDNTPVVENRMVTPGYFAAMDIPFRRGADFTGREVDGTSHVVIVNETMARQFFPDTDPIGARIQLGLDGGKVVREVVGVVGDVRSGALSRPPVPEAFVPHPQAPINSMGFAVRTAEEPAALVPAIRQRIASIDPDLALVRPQTMNELMYASARSMRLSSILTTMFAVVAALLAAIGIYGLVAYSVAQRTREIGIRVALGADARAILRLIIGEACALAFAGLAFGLAGTWALTGTLRTMLFEVSPSDPMVLIATCVAAVVVAGAAALVPARRVMRVDPSIALRAE